jgi:hypothetical protein
MLCVVFLKLQFQFGFGSFLQKNISAKAAGKMSVKIYYRMKTAVNFINNLRTNFSYETSFRQLFSRYMYVKKDIRTKNSYVNVDEIDGRSK